MDIWVSDSEAVMSGVAISISYMSLFIFFILAVVIDR